MLAMAPQNKDEEGGGGGNTAATIKEEKLDDLPALPNEQQLAHFKLTPLDQEEEMEILHSIKQETAETTRDRIVDSLAASYPAGALSKHFQFKEEEDPLSSSCFAQIRLDKSKIDEGFDSDDELTSLSWLQDSDLLRGMRVGSECSSPCDDDAQKENDTASGQYQAGIYGQPHPPHVPYNPQKHVNSKPPYSFSCLIFMAIEDNPEKKLPVKDIYNWILTHFPYFQNAPTGWKNSVRHNLSLNKCFKKVEKDRCSNIGKGSLWMIDPDFRPNLLQALRKTPYHPYHQLQMFNNAPTSNLCLTNGTQKPLPLQPRYNVNTPSPHLFPFLSRRLAQSNFVSSGAASSQDEVADLVSDIDVANTLVSLKRAASARPAVRTGARSRSPSPPEFGSEREKELLKQKKLRALGGGVEGEDIVVYAPPSDDHSYSVTEALLQQQGSMSPESSIDEEYEFGNNDKSTSEMEDELFSESDYDEEGWSEEEELYERERLKLYSRAPIITTTAACQTGGRGVIPAARRGSYVTPRTRVITQPHIVRKQPLFPIKHGLRTTTPQHKTTPRIHSPRNPHKQHQKATTTDAEEDLKIAEGANALLNLAGIRSAHIVPLRSISPATNAQSQQASTGNNNNNVIKMETGSVEEEMET